MSEVINIPRLRFPEFERTWKKKSIQELIDDKYIIEHLDGNHGALYPKSEEFTEEGIPYIAANDLINSNVYFENCKRLPKNRASIFKKGIAKNELIWTVLLVCLCCAMKTDLDLLWEENFSCKSLLNLFIQMSI